MFRRKERENLDSLAVYKYAIFALQIVLKSDMLSGYLTYQFLEDSKEKLHCKYISTQCGRLKGELQAISFSIQ